MYPLVICSIVEYIAPTGINHDHDPLTKIPRPSPSAATSSATATTGTASSGSSSSSRASIVWRGTTRPSASFRRPGNMRAQRPVRWWLEFLLLLLYVCSKSRNIRRRRSGLGIMGAVCNYRRVSRLYIPSSSLRLLYGEWIIWMRMYPLYRRVSYSSSPQRVQRFQDTVL